MRAIYLSNLSLFFLFGVFEINHNKTDRLRLLTMPVILLKDKPMHSADEYYRVS